MRNDDETPSGAGPEQAEAPDPRDVPVLDPDAPPAAPNEEHPAPEHPFKDQGDPLEGG